MGASIRLVCFDLGGVVVRICRSWREGCAVAGVPFRDGDAFSAEALRARRRLLNDSYQSGRISCSRYFSEIAEATGGLYSPEEVSRIHLAWTLDDYPGIADLIDRINRSGVCTTACLSNTNASHWRTLTVGDPSAPHPHARRPSQAISKLRHHFVSHRIGAIKPHEPAFRCVERALGLKPGEIIFFDDLPENVDAARALGWHAHRIDHEQDTAAQITGHLRDAGIPLS